MNNEENNETTTTAPAPATAKTDYGNILLLIPAIGTALIWFWVGSMNLFQNPASSLQMVALGVVISTAILIAKEAKELGLGQGAKETSPTMWGVCTAFMWVLCYPIYFFKRKSANPKSPAILAIIMALVFFGSLVTMNMAIEDQKGQVRNDIQQMQSGLEQAGQEFEAEMEKAQREMEAEFGSY